jgi:hypothetical protein
VSDYVNQQLGEEFIHREAWLILHGDRPSWLPTPKGFTEDELKWLADEEEKRHRPQGWMIG